MIYEKNKVALVSFFITLLLYIMLFIITKYAFNVQVQLTQRSKEIIGKLVTSVQLQEKPKSLPSPLLKTVRKKSLSSKRQQLQVNKPKLVAKQVNTKVSKDIGEIPAQKQASLSKPEQHPSKAEKEQSRQEQAPLSTSEQQEFTQIQLAEKYPQFFNILQLYLQVHKHYPMLAKRRGIQGRVKLRVKLNAQGELQKLTIIKSSSYSVLDRAARHLVKSAFPLQTRVGKKIDFTINVSYYLKEV